MSRPLCAVIHGDALTHNLACVRRLAPTSKVWAIVKANAYGHGLARVFPELREADGFGLLNIEEAISLRHAGWRGPILLLEGFFSVNELALIDQYDLATVVHCDEQIAMIDRAQLSRPIHISLKMNSGMNRLGFPPGRFHAVWKWASAHPKVGRIVLMTHFSDADSTEGVADQLACFERGAAGIAGECCLANSAAILLHPCTHTDWVRPGIMLYGASPLGYAVSSDTYGLKPVMTLKSEIIATQSISTGETVGYGSVYRAGTSLRVGVVACGYADGYPLHAPTGTPVMVCGVKTQLVGRVSMDMMTVDLTPVPQAGVGSPVELWGAHLSVNEVAAAAGTMGYELLCAIAPRVPVHMR